MTASGKKLQRCAICGGLSVVVVLTKDQVAREIDFRSEFVMDRFHYAPSKEELMDLTEFMHGGEGRLLRCLRCGVVSRQEPAPAHYENDIYDSGLVQQLYPRYLEAFREKRALYEGLLRPRAEVLEPGSHYGAFLQTAEEWHWRPIGVDIGEHTTRFARSLGLTVRSTILEDLRVKQRADAVFCWNCFEQMEDPGSALVAMHSLLQRHGIIVVRVPNFHYYEYWRKGKGAKRLAYGNLLGFPYRFGYTPQSLSALLQRYGFQPIATHSANLITMPFPEPQAWVRKEMRKAERKGPRSSAGGPWIEVVARRAA